MTCRLIRKDTRFLQEICLQKFVKTTCDYIILDYVVDVTVETT